MYLWLVTLHLVGLILFLLTHGTSMFIVFRVRKERSRDSVATLLSLSARANQVMYLGLLLLGIGGLGAAWSQGWLLAPWVIASYIVVVVTILVMYAAGAGFYYPIREGLEGSAKVPRLEDEELFATLAGSRRPELLGTAGIGALVILTWLMVFKPG